MVITENFREEGGKVYVKRFSITLVFALIIASLMGCGSDESTPNALSNDQQPTTGDDNQGNVDNDGDHYTESDGDCNDDDSNINPGAKEVCGNSVDDDCKDGDLACPDSGYEDPDTYDPGTGDLLGPKPPDNHHFDSEVTPSEPGQCDPCNDGIITIAGGGFFGMEGERVVIYSSSVFEDSPTENITQGEITTGILLGYLWTDVTGDATFENTRNPGQPFSLVNIDGDIFGSEVTLPGGFHRIIFVIDYDPVMDNPNQPEEIGDNDMIGSCVISVNGETFMSMYHDDLEWLPFGSLEPDEDANDNDGDGYTVGQGDCDDNNKEVHPGASETCDDGIDQDCSGEDLACSEPKPAPEPEEKPDDVDNDHDGYTENQGDCDDNNKEVHPGANAVCGNNVDENCDGKDPACPPDPRAVDNDHDGYTENQGDCNDGNRNIHPKATDVCGNGVDEDCNGGDRACPDPKAIDDDGDKFTENQGDCNDKNRNIHPGAAEVLNNNVDENCNGLSPTTKQCDLAHYKMRTHPEDVSAAMKEDCGL